MTYLIIGIKLVTISWIALCVYFFIHFYFKSLFKEHDGWITDGPPKNIYLKANPRRKEKIQYLCTVETFYGTELRLLFYGYVKKDDLGICWYEVRSDDVGYHHYPDEIILAWRPLPKPYKPKLKKFMHH